jgi:NTE family protein
VRALLLGGGGHLGAFSAGALLSLEAAGWRPDLLIASSAGAINALRSSAGGARAAAEFWASLEPSRLVWRALAVEPFGGLLGGPRFYALVEAGVDFEALFSAPLPLAFLVVDLETGRVALRGNRTEPDADRLRLVSRAAYSLPPLLPPVDVGGRPLADGGLLRNAPLERALELGASEIVYLCNVRLEPPPGYRGRSIAAATWRYLDVFFRRASNVGFADAAVVDGRLGETPVVTIAPPPEPAGLPRPPTRARLRRLDELGRARGAEALAALRAGPAHQVPPPTEMAR